MKVVLLDLLLLFQFLSLCFIQETKNLASSVRGGWLGPNRLLGNGSIFKIEINVEEVAIKRLVFVFVKFVPKSRSKQNVDKLFLSRVELL